MIILKGKKASKIRILMSLFKSFKKDISKGIYVLEEKMFFLIHLKKLHTGRGFKPATRNKFRFNYQYEIKKEKLTIK